MERLSAHERYVEILDTTLRDGEQTPGVAFTPQDKLHIARFLFGKLRIDRLEIGSARVSEGERVGVSGILDWASRRGALERMEILGFVDGGKSADWISQTGGKVINLLTKGSERHCRIQLRKTPEEHFDQVKREIEYAHKLGLGVNVYLEDWSGGMRDSFGYICRFISVLEELPVQRLMLPDTLGILQPQETARYLDLLYSAFGKLRFDFHAHNDYGLATANSLAAVNSGISGLHVTVNGLGERAGNQPLPSIVVAINDMSQRRIRIQEKELLSASMLVQTLSGKRCAWNTPIIGSDVFTQTCGVHADGDKKGNLYANNLLPERFGRRRAYALGKLSGKASLDKNLEALGMELDEDVRKLVLQEIVRLGDKKKQVTAPDLPFIVQAVMSRPVASAIRIADYQVMNSLDRTPKADVVLEVKNERFEASANGDGAYDAIVKALRKALKAAGLAMPKLYDYEVRIPPGGKTDALVETTITWELKPERRLVTTGVDPDQLTAAIIATEKMLNLVSEI